MDKDIEYKLRKRILESNTFKIIYRKNCNNGIYHYFKEDIISISKELIHLSWVIDCYILTFYNQLDKEQLKPVLEMLNNNDKSNFIIDMNMLYNLEIKEI